MKPARFGLCLPAALAAFACGSGPPPVTDGGIRGPDIVVDPLQVGSTADECAEYCQKQAGLCPQSTPAASCATDCIATGQTFPTCEKDWATLNHCMTLDEIACGSLGQPVTTHCVPYVNSYAVCLQTTVRDGG